MNFNVNLKNYHNLFGHQGQGWSNCRETSCICCFLKWQRISHSTWLQLLRRHLVAKEQVCPLLLQGASLLVIPLISSTLNQSNPSPELLTNRSLCQRVGGWRWTLISERKFVFLSAYTVLLYLMNRHLPWLGCKFWPYLIFLLIY